MTNRPFSLWEYLIFGWKDMQSVLLGGGQNVTVDGLLAGRFVSVETFGVGCWVLGVVGGRIVKATYIPICTPPPPPPSDRSLPYLLW